MTSISSPNPQNLAAELRRLRLERLLQTAAHDYELRFEFGNRDLIAQGHIIMRAAATEIASALYPQMKGRALNLLGHCLGDSRPWAEAAKHEEQMGKPYFAAFWHALEDARIENWMVARWPGTHKSFEANMLPNLGGSLLKLAPPVDQLEIGLYLQGRGYQEAHYARRITTALQAVTQEIAYAVHAPSASETYQCLLEIYPTIAHLIPVQQTQALRDSNDYENEVIQADNDEIPPSVNEPDDDQPPEGVPDFMETEDVVSVDVGGRRQEFPEWFRPGSAPWFELDIGEKQIHPSAVRHNRLTIVDTPQGSYESYRMLKAEIDREAGYLARRLQNMIRGEMYLRFGGQYRSGKLNMAKLWKQRIGNYRLFQRPLTVSQRAAAFTLLVDESASMKGQDKHKIAKKAALLIGESLELLAVPLEIIGFTTAEYEARAAMTLGLTPAYKYRTTRCSPLEHRLYKSFYEPYHNVRSRLTDIQPRKNNWDEEHLLFAFQRIQERPELKKIIIVIGDGQPNGDANVLIETVQRIESMGVKVIGIGIGADFVHEIYSNAIVVADFRQMANELLRIIAHEYQVGVIPG